MSDPLQCYRVELPCTNSMKDCAQVFGKYVTVEHGYLYVVAKSMSAVADAYPTATKIERIGLGATP